MPVPQHFTPREMIEKLVSFDTTSHLSNLHLIEFVESYRAACTVSALSRRGLN